MNKDYFKEFDNQLADESFVAPLVIGLLTIAARLQYESYFPEDKEYMLVSALPVCMCLLCANIYSYHHIDANFVSPSYAVVHQAS